MPVGVARALSTRTDQPVFWLRWAAQQATLLSPRRGPPGREPPGPPTTRDYVPPRAEFLAGIGGIFDYAGNALALTPGKSPQHQRLELTAMGGPSALTQSRIYHDYLSKLDEGMLLVPKGADPYQVAALLGVSPGALRARNGPRMVRDGRAWSLGETIPGGRPPPGVRTGGLVYRMVAAEPLHHRHVVFRLPNKRAWIWVHPDDKVRLGAGYGWCVSDSAFWRRSLQFAVVDKDNRPHVLLTLSVGRPGPSGVMSGGYNPNDLIIRTPPTPTEPGRARIDHRKIKSLGVGVFYGQVKGRYNQRPPPSPYREDILRWAFTQPFGPLRVEGKHTDAADWAAILTVADDIPMSRRNWKRVGGAPSVFSVADHLQPDVMGEGGPREKSLTYFGSDPAAWLKTPMAPLVLAAMGSEVARRVAPNLPAILRAERVRMESRLLLPRMEGRVTVGPELAEARRRAVADLVAVRRAGIALPEKLIRGWRSVLAAGREKATLLDRARAHRDAQAVSVAYATKRLDKYLPGEPSDHLATLWRLFESSPRDLIRLHVAVPLVLLADNKSPMVNALICELFVDAVVRRGEGPAKLRARAEVIAELVELSTRLAGSPAGIELIREVYGQYGALPHAGQEGAAYDEEEGRYFDETGSEVGPDASLAWVLASQSEPGSGTWHCARCAGFEHESVVALDYSHPWEDKPGKGPRYVQTMGGVDAATLAGGYVPTCFMLSSYFYEEMVEAWGIMPGYGITSALMDVATQGDAAIGHEEAFRILTEDMDEHDVQQTAAADPLLTLGLLRSLKSEAFQSVWENGWTTRARWVAMLRHFRGRLSPVQQRILRNLIRALARAQKRGIHPVEFWVLLLPYFEQWRRSRLAQGWSTLEDWTGAPSLEEP